jgi:ATP-dependent helicase YprA (DUF1998 family)
VLSCTPTLEMGIDIGDLSAVVLAALPRSPAGYTQQTGRAGRRTGNAFLLTIPERSRRDLYFLDVPEEMVAGRIVPPGILVNDVHLLARQVSSLAHELGHHLLEHPFDAVLLTEDKKCRQFDAAKEKEAKFLSGELLIPQKAARRAAFAGKTNEEVADHFGVTPIFAQMQMPGARIYAQNALRRQGAAR